MSLSDLHMGYRKLRADIFQDDSWALIASKLAFIPLSCWDLYSRRDSGDGSEIQSSHLFSVASEN